MKTTNTTKNSVELFVEVVKEFTLKFYGATNTFNVGHRIQVKKRDLCKDGYVVVLGHGVDEIVPWDYIKLVRVTTKRTITEMEIEE